MASSPHDSDAAQARLVLGLSGAASEAELQAAYWALRAHIESRAVTSEDPGFVAARVAELQQLTERLALALDVPPDSLPSPRIEAVQPAPRQGWPVWLGIGGFVAALLIGLVYWLMRAPSDATDASPLAAVAQGDPPGRLVFAESPTAARFTVLDAEGTRVVRAGIVSSDPVELAPGQYSVWLSALACDASRHNTIRVETDADIELVAPECTRTLALVLRSDVTGDRVRIDGEDVGSTGPGAHILQPGSHEIAIEHGGREAWRAEIEVGSDDRLTLHADLAAKANAADEPEGSPDAGDSAETARPPPPPGRTAGPPPRPPGSSGRPGGTREGLPGGTSSESPVRDTQVAGSRSWHDAVRRRLIDKYDENGSRSLDTTIEIASIPCSEWLAIESQYETGGLQVPMTRLYGFDGSEWVEGALGVERGLRDFTYRRMKECGLK